MNDSIARDVVEPWLRLRPTPLAGLAVVERRVVADERGWFGRVFCADELRGAGFTLPVAQINRSLTRRRGAARGLHYQRAPHAEDKLVTCLRGRVFDVAVDLRRSSPTFLRWFGVELSADNALGLLIPQGLAHGFQALEDDCELLYVHSRPYCAGAEAALHVADPALAVAWPLPLGQLSPRDEAHPFVTADFAGA